jgi:hypothetical protein
VVPVVADYDQRLHRRVSIAVTFLHNSTCVSVGHRTAHSARVIARTNHSGCIMAKSGRRTDKLDSPARRASRTTMGGPSSGDPSPVVASGDDLAAKFAGTQELASKFPFNAAKPFEYDPSAATGPKAGQSAKPSDPIVGASTVTEPNGSDTVGSGAPSIGTNRANGPLDRVRAGSADRVLTWFSGGKGL